jgi:hypothetical protein
MRKFIFSQSRVVKLVDRGGGSAHGEDVIFHGRYNYLIRPNGTRGRLRNQFNVLTTPWREHCARRGREALALAIGSQLSLFRITAFANVR